MAKYTSKGERRVIKILRQAGIKYKREHIFPDCVYKNPLRFDFYLADRNTCIEFDGSQHYIGWFGDLESLRLNQIRDDIKNKYCLEKGITLIRLRKGFKTKDLLKKLNGPSTNIT